MLAWLYSPQSLRRKASKRHLDGFAEAHLVADEAAAAVAQHEAHALALEPHQPLLQLGRDIRVAPAFVLALGCRLQLNERRGSDGLGNACKQT